MSNSNLVDFEGYLRGELAALGRGGDFARIWRSFFEPKAVGFFALCGADAARLELDAMGVRAEQIFDFELPFFIAAPEFKPILSRSAMFNEGRIYIQNASSFLCANLLGAGGKNALEMCAAPGGKSIILAQKAASLGAIERDRGRFFTLKSNLKKYGCERVRTFCKDARSVAHTCAGRFGAVLLDAPCSAYSHFGADFRALKKSQIRELARLQKGLLNAALSACERGGEVVYSTCTFFADENEEVVQNALGSRFAVRVAAELAGEVAQVAAGLERALGRAVLDFRAGELGVRILPNEIFEGFFICKLRRE